MEGLLRQPSSEHPAEQQWGMAFAYRLSRLATSQAATQSHEDVALRPVVVGA